MSFHESVRRCVVCASDDYGVAQPRDIALCLLVRLLLEHQKANKKVRFCDRHTDIIEAPVGDLWPS